MRGFAATSLAALSFLHAGSAGFADDATPPAAPATARPRVAYRVVALDPKAVGVIEGRCVLEADVVAEPEDASRCCGGPRRSDRVVIGEDRGLANCVVSIATISEGRDWLEPMRMEDRTVRFILEGPQARYRQRVAWTRTGTQLVIDNRTAFDLNAHGFSGSETVFNFAVGPGKSQESVADAFLSRAGTYAIRDDCCPGIDAVVFVSVHPYVVVTDAVDVTDRRSGSWRLDDVPPGTYDLVCWHEPLRRASAKVSDAAASEIRLVRSVRVEAGKTVSVDFMIPVPESMRAPVVAPK